VRRRLGAAAALALLPALLLAGCGPAERGEPFAPPVRLASAEAEAGQRVFMTYCHQCHPGGAAGLGPALNNKPLPGFLIKYQVRHGLGAMPEFDERRISDEELDRLVAYLIELRRAG
jgi:mono/diheme cytochrome c family protein